MGILSSVGHLAGNLISGATDLVTKPLKFLMPDINIDIPKPEAPPGRDSVDLAEQNKRLARRALEGRQSTIQTSALGDTSTPNLARKKLLGQ